MGRVRVRKLKPVLGRCGWGSHLISILFYSRHKGVSWVRSIIKFRVSVFRWDLKGSSEINQPPVNSVSKARRLFEKPAVVVGVIANRQNGKRHFQVILITNLCHYEPFAI